ncbi:uncharacterized protein L199_004969 [Kwoniella botswanensis]|uniref:uncharacterized protein n=1 Tax=Kwoniella botswanensis TaxID=1268659 RepID=UPI00315DDF70
MKSLFKGKRFYIYCPPDHQAEGENEIVGEEDWEKDVRYCKSDIESYGGQVITSPNYNVNHILIYPTHLERYLGNFNHNHDYGCSHLKPDLILDIPLEQVAPIDDWDQFEYGIIPWTVAKIIERYGDTTPSGTGKEVILKLGWVKSCISAQRVLDQRYGEFGWAGMSIRSRIAANGEPETGPGRSSTDLIEISDEDLDSVFSTPRVRSEQFHDDDEMEEQVGVQMLVEREESISANNSDHFHNSALPSVDQASDDMMTASGPSSAIPSQAIHEKWECDIHAELDRLLGQKGKKKAVINQAAPVESLRIYLRKGASLIKFIVEDLGHTTRTIEVADVIVLQRLDDGPPSLRSKTEDERQLIGSAKEHQKVVSSQWLIESYKARQTINTDQFTIKLAPCKHKPAVAISANSPIAGIDQVALVRSYPPLRSAAISSFKPNKRSLPVTVSGDGSDEMNSEDEMDMVESSDDDYNDDKDNNTFRFKRAKKVYGVSARPSVIRDQAQRRRRDEHLCRLILDQPEGIGMYAYLTGCEPKYGITNWGKSYNSHKQTGRIDQMVKNMREQMSKRKKAESKEHM